MTTTSELLDRFERADLEEFRHGDHVRVAWAYLGRDDAEAAFTALARGLARFAAAKGKPERFHYTMTRAWFGLVAAARRQRPDARSAGELLAACPELGDPGLIHQYYTPEALASDRARQAWVEPDLAPLPATL
jgi:hypothetical protein